MKPGRLLIQLPAVPAAIAQPESVVADRATNKRPSATIWNGTPPFDGLTNCGKNARKKSAVCGLSTFTITPCAKTRRKSVRARTTSGGGSPFDSVRMPSTIRYAAPAYFTVLNAVAEDIISADNPSAAAATWSSVPVQMPRTDTRPATRPWSMLRVTMYKTAGPGVRRSATAAPTKRPRAEASGMCARHRRQLARDECLGHHSRAIRLWTGGCHPLVFAAVEYFELTLAACCLVGSRKFFLHGRKHVVVERTLHDQQRHEPDRLVALEDFLRIAFVDRVPRLEKNRVVLDHGVPLQPLGILKARIGVADRRARRDVGDGRVDVWRPGQRNRVVARIARAHGEQFGDMAAARASIHTD